MTSEECSGRVGAGYADYFDGLVQERRNSIANALELRLCCTNLLIEIGGQTLCTTRCHYNIYQIPTILTTGNRHP